MEAGYEMGMSFWLREENLTSKYGVETSVRSQILNIFSFEGHLISIVTTQLCPHCVKAAMENV